MTYQFPEIRKFLGLYAQANSFSLPDGAMEQTTNIVIQDDNTVTKLPGTYTYFTPGGGTVLVNLHLYQSVLLATFTTKISYFTDTGIAPNVTGVQTDLTGAAFTIASPRISRAVQSNGNFYWTTDAGVMKIDAYNGKVYKSGSPPGLDIRGNFLTAAATAGIFIGDAEVAYRVVFGRQDANANLILGAPSDFLVLTNSKQVGVSWTRTTNVVTVTNAGHNLATGAVITVSNSTGAAKAVAAGTYTVTVLTSSTFTIPSTAADDAGPETLDYAVARTPLVEFSVPREITSTSDNYFFQLFRTSFSNATASSPSPDFRLVQQRLLTAGEIAAGVVFYQDTTDPVLVTNAPELYTNPNSQEGELQANARAPLCDDVTFFQNYVFYGNCISRQILNVNVVAAGDLVNNDYVEIKVDSTTRRYVANTGVGNKTAMSQAITNAGGNLSVSYTTHGLSNGYTVYVSVVTGGSLTQGTYFIVGAGANAFQLSLTSGGTPIAYNSETSLWFEGVTDGTNPIFFLDSSSSSVSVQLRNTAQGIVKAVNRDAAALVYANYVSAIDGTPGQMRFIASGFTGTIFMRANTTNAGLGFAPPLPNAFNSGTQVNSSGATQVNACFISKVGEPEAVPVANNILIGSSNKKILRIIALRDSVIVLKEDGVFKIVGDNPQNFTSIALDNTVIVAAANSASLLNNQVYFLSNQGICIATDSAVQIASRRIERLIEPIIGSSNIATQTAAVGYESNRTYRICTLIPNGTSAAAVYIHNTINDTWTDSDNLFSAGAVGPSNILYLISTGNTILKERKLGDRTDYCAQNHAITVVSVASDKLSAVISTTAYTPAPGDVILKNSVFSRIRTVTVSGSNFSVTLAKQTNLVAADSVNAYQSVLSKIKMAPFHAGMVGRDKQFSQVQIDCRTYNITRISISFAGQSFGSSPATDWVDTNVAGATGGWGFLPWGFFGWGVTDGIQLQTTTEVAPVIRTLVPQLQARNTFIQLMLQHSEAGESMDIQAVSWCVRAYMERVTK